MSEVPTPTYVSKLVDDLFTAAFAHLNKRKVALLQSLTEIEPYTHIRFKGKVYAKSTGNVVTVPAKAFNHPHIKSLPQNHIAYFTQLLNEEDEMVRDKKSITQLFTIMVNPCKSEQDLRDALPDMVLPESLKMRFPRTRPAGYTLGDSPSHKRRYDRQYRKLCMYASMRLIY